MKWGIEELDALARSWADEVKPFAAGSGAALGVFLEHAVGCSLLADTPEIGPAKRNVWQKISLAEHVSKDDTAVGLWVLNTNATLPAEVWARRVGSTDDAPVYIPERSSKMVWVGLPTRGRRIEIKMSETKVFIYLVLIFGSGLEWFTSQVQDFSAGAEAMLMSPGDHIGPGSFLHWLNEKAKK